MNRPYWDGTGVVLPDEVPGPNGWLVCKWFTWNIDKTIAVVLIEWECDEVYGWFKDWAFFCNGNEVSWEQLDNKEEVTVVIIQESPYGRMHKKTVFPWPEEMTAMVILELL